MQANGFLAFLLTLTIVTASLVAQVEEKKEETVKVSAQIRNRGEVDMRAFDSRANSYDYLRTRLGITLTPLENYAAFIQIQDSRVFGATGKGSTISDTNNIRLHQAYFHIRQFLWSPIELKIGRMELNYGDQRLVGALDWSNTARSFDGTVTTFNFGGNKKLDFIAMKVEEAGRATSSGDTAIIEDREDRIFSGLYGMHPYSDALKVDYYVFTHVDGTKDIVSGKNELEQITVGLFVRGDAGNIGYKTEMAYQTGKQAGLDIAAFMLTGAVGYAFKEASWKPSFWVGYDHLSGDDDATDDRYQVFSTVFAANHKFYGYMDYFLDIPKHTLGLGLQDIMVKTKVQPWKKTYFGLDYHYFMSAKKSAAGESKFGQEFDLTGGYKFNDYFVFDFGLAAFITDDLMKARFDGRDDVGYFGYSNLVFSF